MSEKVRHINDSIILSTVVAVALGLSFYFRFDRTYLAVIWGTCSLLYVFWGIIHHKVEGRLTTLIALEYILYGLLAFALLYTALNF